MSDAPIINFSQLTVPNLRSYLQKRGVQVTGYVKSQLVKLAECVSRLELPEDPDHLAVDIGQEIKQRWEQAGCSTNPFDLQYSSSLNDAPEFGLFDIFNYLICSRSECDRRSLAAYKSWEDYRLFRDGNVLDLKYDCIGNGSQVVAFKAEVKPTQKAKTYLKKTTYSLWFLVHRETAEVKAAYCECIGGADGACRHVAAALYALEAHEKRSCTDGPSQWVKRSRQQDGPIRMRNLKIQTISYGKKNQDLEDRRATFDPRHQADRTTTSDTQIADFAKALKDVAPECGVLTLLGDPDQSEEDLIDVECMNMSLLNKAKTYLSSFTTTAHIQVEDVIRSLSYSPSQITYIEEKTRGQAENPTWLKMRQGLVTASSVQRVCSRVETIKENPGTLPEKLLEFLFKENGSDDENINPNLEHGHLSEPKARRLYEQLKRKTHRHLKVSTAGLLLSSAHPYLGCSVDGVVKCKCHGIKLIEVKAPSALKEKHPKDAALQRSCYIDEDGKWQLRQKSGYYYQIQCQLGLYKLKECDLVIYTKKGIHIIEVTFNETFFSEMVSKIEFFYSNFGIIHLLQTAASI